MNLFNDFQKHVHSIIAGLELKPGLDLSRVVVEPPRDASHGDMATNAGLVLSKELGKKPQEIAQLIADKLKSHADVENISVLGPGFLNWRLKDGCWQKHAADILKAGAQYGLENIGQNQCVNVEFVSANPTGPMHVGHGRGAVFGDALASLLESTGFKVIREYYINDAGAQVEKLARSLHLRYREQFGESIGEIPPGLYPGEYLTDVAKALAARDGKKWLGVTESEFLEPLRQFAVDHILSWIKEDLAALGVKHRVFSSEHALLKSGAVEKAIEYLKGKGLIYTGVLEPPKGKKPDDWEERPQTLFKATDFGDEIDRPLQKSDGSNTYFANDIAYHLDKYRRGAKVLINCLGADHGGYVKRISAAVKAISDGEAVLDVKLMQMISILKDGQPMRMSKRAGTFVTLRDVVDEVGKDVFRFIIMTRKNDVAFEFDLSKALEQSKDNPVFYVQYAHARICSVLRHAATMFGADAIRPEKLQMADMGLLRDEAELDLIKFMATWPRHVEAAALSHEPHRLCFYLQELAGRFHALWNKGRDHATLRFLIEGEKELTLARLAMIQCAANVIACGLGIFGVTPLKEMHDE
jgi:arginyl-tRNA synthetase